MVLAEPVGRKRSFALGLLLTVVTFGIYAVYWNYKAHNEVYRQFELARENRDEGMAWYVLGLVVPPFLLAYLWVMAANVDYVRQRIGLPRRQTPGRFLWQVGIAAACLALAAIALLFVPLGQTPEEGAEPVPLTPEEVATATTLEALSVVLLLVGAVMLAIAYYGLQRDVNELWDAFHARIAYLRAHPEPPVPPAPVWTSSYPPVLPPYAPPPPVESMATARRYYADLSPPAPAVPAPPPTPEALRAERDRLRREHPDLALLEDVEPLLARAEAGEPEALEAARSRVAEVVAFTDERRRIVARREQVLAAMEGLEARLTQGQVDEPAYDAERTVLERDWRELTERLERIDDRLSGPP